MLSAEVIETREFRDRVKSGHGVVPRSLVEKSEVDDSLWLIKSCSGLCPTELHFHNTQRSLSGCWGTFHTSVAHSGNLISSARFYLCPRCLMTTAGRASDCDLKDARHAFRPAF